MNALPLLLLLSIDVPPELRSCVASIRADALGGVEPLVEVVREPGDVLRFRLTFDLPQPVAQDDWRIDIEPAFAPDFHWSPHLTPTPRHVVDQHSFRSPALIASAPGCTLALVPDLDLLLERPPVRWYMDLDAPARKLTLGMSDTEVEGHVFYVRKPGASYPKGKVQFGFFALASAEARRNPFRPVLSFLWERYGRSLFEQGRPLRGDLAPYVEHTYRWAFESWREAVWQEFELEGRKVGAPVFIVNQTQSPNYPGEVDEREFRSIWNQAWFSSLRSASGLFRWARARGNEELLAKARMTKELALLAPMTDGFFPSLIATEMETVERTQPLQRLGDRVLGQLRSKSGESRGGLAERRSADRALPRSRHELDVAPHAALARGARAGRAAARVRRALRRCVFSDSRTREASSPRGSTGRR